MNELFNNNGAILSKDRTHRYSLWRKWDENKPCILFIGLNPSRADETYNDPTIRRCINFAKAWGYGGMYFLNLYSYRTPEVKALKSYLKSPEAYLHLETVCHLENTIKFCDKVVCCWGSWDFISLAEEMIDTLIKIENKIPYCFGINNNGSPKHPLYLKSDTQLIPYIYKLSTI